MTLKQMNLSNEDKKQFHFFDMIDNPDFFASQHAWTLDQKIF